ncbi:unnamed protein product [Cylindrotheca closterium]|uniref:Uncharacterized protein n=1 Tax=Cylindrotheca closterium TaxID=2856 RepID=A0AAD2FZ70_9STRA|nr:unnamed protein product [Cylindrotheca closterium]
MATTTQCAAVDQSATIMSSRIAELKERRRSLTNSIPMNRTSSSLSMASLRSDRSSVEDETEKLERSLSRIRIRRPSLQVNVDLNGIVGAEPTIDETKSEMSSVSKTSKQEKSASLAPTSMLGKAYAKAILANYPDQQSAVSKVYKKTILANYPVPAESQKSVDSITERTLSFSDGGSERSGRSS